MYIKARSRKQAQNDDDDVNDDNVNVVDADADAEVDQDEVRVGVSSCRHTLKRVYLVGKWTLGIHSFFHSRWASMSRGRGEETKKGKKQCQGEHRT